MWCGVARYDMVWYGIIRYGMVYGLAWHGMVQCGMVSGMAWHGMVWYNMVWHDTVQCIWQVASGAERKPRAPGAHDTRTRNTDRTEHDLFRQSCVLLLLSWACGPSLHVANM